MDFDSPDVAKDFPGLAKALSDATEYDDWDKSKKKKEKKDSKKDKERGYATLADSPDEDELADSKNSSKGIKIKAFKLSSKKKDKDNKKESSTKSHDKEKELHRKSSSSDKDTKKVDEDKSKTLPMTEVPIQAQRRPFDGQGYKNSTSSSISSKSSTKVKSGPSSSSNSNVSTEKSKGLNVFLNAPVPLLLKKKDKDKDKEVKKEHSRVKLKLKRGSKSSLEENSAAAEGNQGVCSHPQFPEDPEVISKEIRKYEVLLEQTHAQIKSGKKVSKKNEEQLWELQRTLTQLKRKLRSVNALSASFQNPQPQPTAGGTSKTSSSSESERNPNISSAAQPSHHSISPPPISTLPVVEDIPLDFTPREEIQQHPVLESKIIPNDESIDSTKIQPLEVQATTMSQEPESEIHETLQVQVEVHSNSRISQENPTPEDIFAQEIQSFRKTSPCIGPGRRENVNVNIIEKGKQLLSVQDTPESSKSKSEDPPQTASSVSGEESANRVTTSDIVTAGDIDQEEGDYVYLKIESKVQSQKPPEEKVDISQQQKKIVTAPSIFDPFALPEFKTDEFITAENEALILFNQQLQDEIVKEEEEIEILLKQFQELAAEREGSKDLTLLDDDELVNLWQVVKLENDTLNEQVLYLKTMVASSRLEEFRLETRVNYLRDKKIHGGIASLDEEI